MPQSIDMSWLVFWAALPVLLVAQAIIIVTTLRGGRQSGQPTIYVRGNTRMEFVWAIIPALMLATLLFMTYDTLRAGR
ncbi:MAG: hypothetical protein HYX97_02970 [Chloroflexi bacterium]|nr:hypothetical protein [Chloroflexota bacterium]